MLHYCDDHMASDTVEKRQLFLSPTLESQSFIDQHDSEKNKTNLLKVTVPGKSGCFDIVEWLFGAFVAVS